MSTTQGQQGSHQPAPQQQQQQGGASQQQGGSTRYTDWASI